ncbi:MAG: DUF3592 domain-containing protein [Gammaproteobacteria bacterium]|nr:DUF3592 domain-containing protein [Gammaproteobacteria bacterium]
MKGKVFLFLFALPFFAVGAWMGYAIGDHLLDARAMNSWQPVDAKLSAAGYRTHSGDDSDTYEAYGQYAYTWNGQPYYNDRVAVAGGADNIGDYQRDLGRRLSNAMSRGESIIVYVDPENPADAVIDRKLRWGLLGFKAIFFLVFGGVGLGLMIWVFLAPPEKDTSTPAYVDKPWLANDDWQTGTIRSASKSTMWFSWGFAALWNLISAPLPFVVYTEVAENHNTIALVGLLFPVVGIGLLWWAIARTMEWRRFGPAPVNLDPFPGSIGGHVGGTFDVNLPYDPSARFSVTLTSLHSYVSGSGDNRSRKETAKWQDVQVAHAASAAGGTRLSFRFDVPEGLNESDADHSDDAYDLWRLNLKADLPGTDIDRDYEIPVYATAQQSRRLSSFSIEAAESDQREIDMADVRSLFTMEQGVNGKTMVYPMFRHSYNGIVGFLIGSVFTGAGWFLAFREDHWFMGGIFGFVGSLIALFGLYYLFNSLEVTANGGRVRSVRRILGIPVKRSEMRRADFVRFRREVSLSTQSGSKHVMYYKLLGVGSSGQELVVGEGFKGTGQADAAEEFISGALMLQPERQHRDQFAEFGDANLLATD